MAKEPQSPVLSTRSTRSSAAAAAAAAANCTPSNPSPESKPTTLSTPRSLRSDLLFPAEPTSLSQLLSYLPGRKPQILDLLRLIGPLNSHMLPILLYGGASTGKTSTALQVFRHLNRPFVYASCRSCYCPRVLFDSVLSQLLGHCTRRCEWVSDFVSSLRGALLQVAGELKEKGSSLCTKGASTGGNGKMVYLVFDNVELVRSWEKGSPLLSLLLRLHDIMKIPEVGFIYISAATPDAYYSMMGSIEPNHVYFPDYTVEELHSIFMRNQANPNLYSSFLSVVLKPFFRVTRRVDELATAFEPLFHKYCEPLTDLSMVPDEATKRRLFDHLQPHLLASLNETFVLPHDGTCTRKAGTRKHMGRKDASYELDFHMSISAKYLLLSAFLASRNPATLDAALFDSTGGSDGRKRRRKSMQASLDRKDNAAEEILVKGPGTFPLERLLAVFQCLTSVSEDALDEEQNQMSIEGGRVGLMSDVLLQLSTLCNSNFLYKSGSCPLEGSTRYRSTIDEDMALKVARSINFPLSKYLYRR